VNEPLRLVGGMDAPSDIHNVEAEAALLGALLLQNKLISETFSIVQPEDFFEPVHGMIFKALHRFDEKGMAADPITLKPVFENEPSMKTLGGAGYLFQLTGGSASLVGARDFARQIADLAGRRRLVEAAQQVIEEARNAYLDSSVEDIVAGFDMNVRSATDRLTVAKPRTAAEMIRMVRERQDAMIDAAIADKVCCRSIPELDALIGPIEPGFILIGGRPGMGKSMLAQSAAWGWASNGHAGEYFHAEMTAEQLAMRFASDLSLAAKYPVPHSRIRKGHLDRHEMEIMDHVGKLAETLPLRFHAVGRCDVAHINSLTARAKHRWASHGRQLKFIVVDYLQLLQVSGYSKNFDRVSAVSKGLLDISKRHEVMVVALSQLGRQVDERKDKRPILSDLKDSGELEQDADGVIFVYREEVYLLKEQPKKDSKDREAWETDFEAVRGKLELIGEKNRHDRPMTKTVRFIGQHFAVRGSDYDEHFSEPMLNLGGEDLL